MVESEEMKGEVTFLKAIFELERGSKIDNIIIYSVKETHNHYIELQELILESLNIFNE